MGNNEVCIGNVKRLVAPIDYMVRDIDDMIDVDTSSGGITNLYFPNILQNGLDRIPKKVYINDVSNNASVGNIILNGLGGNTINGNPTFVISNDGASAEIQPADRTRYLVSLNDSSSGGGAVVHDNSLFGDGTLANPLGVSGIYKTVLFVSEQGDDATGEAGRISLAYRTLEYAKNKAQEGDLIYVLAGRYDIDRSITKHNITYYFQPNATVYQKSCWVLDDSDDVTDRLVTRILGYGNFVLDAEMSSYGHSFITREFTNFTIEFDTITTNSRYAFRGAYGNFYIRGKYINSTANFVVLGSNKCVWDFNVNTIDNIGIVHGSPTYPSSFLLTDLDTTIKNVQIQSKFVFGTLKNNANDRYSTVLVNKGGLYHKIVVKGNIDLAIGKAKPMGLCSALGVNEGGIIEYEGEIISGGSFAKTVNSGTNPSSITINNSKCYCICSDKGWNPIKVSNENDWITIKDSFLKTTKTRTIVYIGAIYDSGDRNEGSVEILNSVLFNDYDNGKDDAFGIITQRNANSGYTLLDNVTIYITVDYGNTFSITSIGYGTVQKCSILGGNVTSNRNREFNVNNNITGTFLFHEPNRLLINPLR